MKVGWQNQWKSARHSRVAFWWGAGTGGDTDRGATVEKTGLRYPAHTTLDPKCIFVIHKLLLWISLLKSGIPNNITYKDFSK